MRPAFARYAAVLRDELLPAARGDDEAGLGALADGDELYRVLIRSNTGLDLDPADVHQIGLDEVAALDEQIVALGPDVRRPHPGRDLRAARTDPQLRYDPSRPRSRSTTPAGASPPPPR